VGGYEIHAGRTTPAGGAVMPLLTIVERAGAAVDEAEGALDAGGAVAGTSVHGLLADDGARRALLCWLARRAGRASLAAWGAPGPATARHDRLADAVAAALDTKAIARLVGRAL
jgi:adenosylcobyric acid synthase